MTIAEGGREVDSILPPESNNAVKPFSFEFSCFLLWKRCRAVPCPPRNGRGTVTLFVDAIRSLGGLCPFGRSALNSFLGDELNLGKLPESAAEEDNGVNWFSRCNHPTVTKI